MVATRMQAMSRGSAKAAPAPAAGGEAEPEVQLGKPSIVAGEVSPLGGWFVLV